MIPQSTRRNYWDMITAISLSEVQEVSPAYLGPELIPVTTVLGPPSVHVGPKLLYSSLDTPRP